MNRFSVSPRPGEAKMKLGVRVRGRRLRIVALVAVCGVSLGWVSPASAGGLHGASARWSLKPTLLRVDTLTDPIGLGDASPSLSWSLASNDRGGSSAGLQTAYEIRVASTAARLDRPDLWESGKVPSR